MHDIDSTPEFVTHVYARMERASRPSAAAWTGR